jgi:hypothetical protein
MKPGRSSIPKPIFSVQFAATGITSMEVSLTGTEILCDEIHWFIPEARSCVLRHNRSSEDFGSMVDGINLWWGEKYTGGKLNNLGYVIGLRNNAAGIGWRLDYDELKGGHINQVYRIPGQKRWGKICHPIDFGTDENSSYSPSFWVRRQWYLWTEMNCNRIPHRVAEEMKRRGVNRLAFPVW